jgi:AAA domain
VKRVLLTGMSGTGKSSVIHALSARGFKAVDTDDGWCEPLPDGRQRWREDAIDRLLDTEDADVLFVAGCEENQVQFHPRFDLIILLSAPVEALRKRLASRTTNSFGRAPGELAPAGRPASWRASLMTCRPSSHCCARRPLMKSGPLCRSAMWLRRSCT